MSVTDRFLAGVGKGMTDIARGVGQVIPTIRNGKIEPLVTREDVQEARRLDTPLMRTTSGTVGNILGQAAMAMPAAMIPGANTTLGAGITGAAMGALQPSVDTRETVTNSVFGGAGGVAGQKIASGLSTVLGGTRNAATVNAGPGMAGSSASVQANPQAMVRGGGAGFGSVDPTDVGALSDSQRSIMNWARANGYRFTPGQASGSRALQQLEAKLESQPMTSGTFNAIKENNQRLVNRAAAKAIGETADTVDSTVLQRAHDRIGGVYSLVRGNKPVGIDPDDFLTRLSGVESEFEGLLPVSLSDNPLVKRFLSFAESGNATQAQLATLTSKLNKAAHNQMTSGNGDRELGRALFQVKDLVDDYLEGSLTGETLKAFQNARGEYRNLMLLTGRQGVVNPSTGNISGANLASTLQARDRQGFLFNGNQSDLYNAARVSQAFRPIVGDSGTATRSMVTNPMELMLSLPINLATRAYASSPVIGLASGASRGVAPNLVGPNVSRFLTMGGQAGGMGLLNTLE
jgi:hypothetical protein